MESNFLPFLPTVEPETVHGDILDARLASGLSTEGLLKLKAVEQAIKLAQQVKIPNFNEFNKLYETIYKFYINGDK